MGFLRVIHADELNIEALRPLWPDALSADHSQSLCHLSNKLRAKDRIIVGPRQIVLQVRGRSLTDLVEEPGGYLFHPDIAKNPRTEIYRDVLEEYLQNVLPAFTQTLPELLCLTLNEPPASAEDLKSMLFCMLPPPVSAAGNAAPDAGAMPNAAPKITPSSGSQSIQDSASDIWICLCGTKNQYNFCKKCGRSGPRTSSMQLCPFCGARLKQETGRKFCTKCGKPLCQ